MITFHTFKNRCKLKVEAMMQKRLEIAVFYLVHREAVRLKS